jgi:hypothetical protein
VGLLGLSELHKKRIEVAVNVWGEILNGSFSSREELVSYLEEVYRTNRLEPIRGKTKINIWDKELATLYVVGKYGLALEEELYSFQNLFDIEVKADRTISAVLEGRDPRATLREHFGSEDEDHVFRVLRLAMTSVVLGFMDEETFIKMLAEFEKAFPELRENFASFKRFYIAFRMAEMIASGKIRNRIEKEAYKHAMCVKLNADKSAPSDDFIRDIVVSTFRVPEHRANGVLRMA